MRLTDHAVFSGALFVSVCARAFVRVFRSLWTRKVVMRAIRKVAATDRAVICTIHQPSTYLFEMFDALLLLKKGGQPVFFGPLGENFGTLISHLEVLL